MATFEKHTTEKEPSDMSLDLHKAMLSKLIYENTTREVNFGDVRSTLPQVLKETNHLVKVRNRIAGNFFACTEEGLGLLIQDALERQKVAPSFFDGMDSFETKEKISMSVLDELPPRASEYSEEDTDSLKGLLER